MDHHVVITISKPFLSIPIDIPKFRIGHIQTVALLNGQFLTPRGFALLTSLFTRDSLLLLLVYYYYYYYYCYPIKITKLLN